MYIWYPVNHDTIFKKKKRGGVVGGHTHHHVTKSTHDVAIPKFCSVC
jgi:hypothetical protein